MTEINIDTKTVADVASGFLTIVILPFVLYALERMLEGVGTRSLFNSRVKRLKEERDNGMSKSLFTTEWNELLLENYLAHDRRHALAYELDAFVPLDGERAAESVSAENQPSSDEKPKTVRIVGGLVLLLFSGFLLGAFLPMPFLAKGSSPSFMPSWTYLLCLVLAIVFIFVGERLVATRSQNTKSRSHPDADIDLELDFKISIVAIVFAGMSLGCVMGALYFNYNYMDSCLLDYAACLVAAGVVMTRGCIMPLYNEVKPSLQSRWMLLIFFTVVLGLAFGLLVAYVRYLWNQGDFTLAGSVPTDATVGVQILIGIVVASTVLCGSFAHSMRKGIIDRAILGEQLAHDVHRLTDGEFDSLLPIVRSRISLCRWWTVLLYCLPACLAYFITILTTG